MRPRWPHVWPRWPHWWRDHLWAIWPWDHHERGWPMSHALTLPLRKTAAVELGHFPFALRRGRVAIDMWSWETAIVWYPMTSPMTVHNTARSWRPSVSCYSAHLIVVSSASALRVL